MPPRVSIIIPNWNGAAHLPTCLNALRAQTFRDFEVIVADNASADQSRGLLASDYPEVKVILLDRNLGFAGACNAGLRAARGEILILLNNDTEAAPDWLAEV
ncbi:MAG: glycosyltransferase family 2 protein, partial [Anaerolineales bacterium]